MNKTGNPTEDLHKITESVQRIVANNVNVQQEVYRITVAALTEGHLETDRVKQVIEAVLNGVQSNIRDDTKRLQESFGQTAKGLDEALASAAIATKLAIQEAASRMGEYTHPEIRKSLHQLESLEKQFLNALNSLATTGTEGYREIISRFAEHAHQSGTAVGARSAEAMTELRDQIEQFSKISFDAGNGIARTTGASILQIASGFLSGVADCLEKVDLTKKDRQRSIED